MESVIGSDAVVESFLSLNDHWRRKPQYGISNSDASIDYNQMASAIKNPTDQRDPLQILLCNPATDETFNFFIPYLSNDSSCNGLPRVPQHETSHYFVVTVQFDTNRPRKFDLNHRIHLFRQASKEKQYMWTWSTYIVPGSLTIDWVLILNEDRPE